MSAQAAFRLLAPITVGSALLGVSLCSRQPEPQRVDLTVQAATHDGLTKPQRGSAKKRKGDAASLAAAPIDLNFVRAKTWSDQVSEDAIGLDLTPLDPDKIPHVVPRELVDSIFKPAERSADSSAIQIAGGREIAADPQVRVIGSNSVPEPLPVGETSIGALASAIGSPAEPMVTAMPTDLRGDQQLASAAESAEPGAAATTVAPSGHTAPGLTLPDGWRTIPLLAPELLDSVQFLSPPTLAGNLPPVESTVTSATLQPEVSEPALALAAVPIAELAPAGAPDESETAELVTVAVPVAQNLASIAAEAPPAAADPLNATPAAALSPPSSAAPTIEQELAPTAAITSVPLAPASPSPSEAAPVPTADAPASDGPALAAATAAAAGGLPTPLAQQASRSFDLTPGQQTFPIPEGGPGFTLDDELILQVKVRGINATDTIIAFGTREAIYLPLGELAMILDLAIRVSDDGNYASGWFLSEDRTVTIDLRQGLLTTPDGTFELEDGLAQAFEGELYIRTEALAAILPMDIEPDLRSQSVLLTTREPFPFEERMRREADRARLSQKGGQGSERELWTREETAWLPLSVPIGDLDARLVSDSQKGTRAETDVRLAGDLAWMTAQVYLSASSRDGLVASLIEMGRRDVDGNLLGPLGATEFAFGDVATAPMPMGLRGTSGRGAYVTNQPFESFSVFDQVDLRGVLPDGYEVELYRNGVLLGSTAQAVNGQYEFLQVPVDYGVNVFRIVFYGPQGQRREEVRRISVGDGRLSPGALEYSFGAVQNGTNVLGVRGPDFRPSVRYGDWQAVGEVSYGFNAGLTGVASAAFFEDDGEARWIAAAGLRTGVAGLALRADAGMSDGGGYATGLGLGGQALGGAFSLSHFEYGGGFIDEVRSFTSDALRRSTELDFNTSLGLASGVLGNSLPINLRARHIEFANGRRQIDASLRGSARLPGFLASHTFEYGRSSSPGGRTFSQLAGDFNLATFNQSRTQFRASLGYQILPQLELTQISGDVDHALDDRTVLRASAGYSLRNDEVTVGLSGIREFDRFTLALDGQYSPQKGTYSAALRLGLSFGRDPLRQRFFIASPGQASSGAVSLRAFQDLDGDRVYGPGDVALPDVNFIAFNETSTSDDEGFARLGELGNGNPVAVQVDPSSLPDIAMAPVDRGIEIVPRPGRFHVLEFPIVELSEIEGTVFFVEGENRRGVSGLRIKLQGLEDDKEFWARSERGGYFFYEQVLPGQYEVVIDPEQAERLGICLGNENTVTVPPSGDIIQQDFTVRSCT
ncbi:hypothetical protein [Aurantiacibacter rhizosphaerae]|uniref:Carboxypeptidase regulatory-like domain-containing protein n=1 Tax=Aurantiacibacter rhizosphaerae TaxID=2691582 RepID=A0A844X9F8_9SPHN|nr:hypothetical protein [Aurantiacibacter rhizosphaerae]MWV26586.1 hypothetical protein [Aurantiacibacter rhizosphaerae]